MQSRKVAVWKGQNLHFWKHSLQKKIRLFENWNFEELTALKVVLQLGDAELTAREMWVDLIICLCWGFTAQSTHGVTSSAVSLPNHTFTGQA